jgi:putative FmdB family regulatory protein
VPTYQYSCTECAEPLEVVQKFSDDPLTECPACGGRLRKIFSPAAIVFRGSGFYRTDSRSGGSGTTAKDNGKKDDAKTETKSETKKDSSSSSSSDSSSSKSSSSGSSAKSTASEKVA